MKSTKAIFFIVAALVIVMSQGVEGRNRRRASKGTTGKGNKDYSPTSPRGDPPGPSSPAAKKTGGASTPTAWKRGDDYDWEDIGTGGSDRGDGSWSGGSGGTTLEVDPDSEIEPFEIPKDRSSPVGAPVGTPKSKKCTDPLC
jgi:hypothetical protein